MYKQNFEQAGMISKASMLGQQQYDGPEVCEAKRDPHHTMLQSQDIMEKTLSVLEMRISNLHTILGPILEPEVARAEKPMTQTEQASRPPRTEREGMLREFTRRINNASESIQNLLERVHP